MNIEERVSKFEDDLSNLKDSVHEIQMQQLRDKNDLEKLIQTTIENSMKPIVKNYESRITVLEQAKANEALKNQNKFKEYLIGGLVSLIFSIFTFIGGVMVANFNSIQEHNINNPNIEVNKNVSK